MSYVKWMVILLAATSFGLPAVAADSQTGGLPVSFRDAVRKVKPAVVYIESTLRTSEGRYTGYGQASGSGVIIDAKKGYVLTAAHVIDGAIDVTVRLEDGRKFTANKLWTDAPSDVGLVQIEGEKLPEAVLGDSNDLEVGDWVLAIGSPFGRALENSVSAGIVSAKGRRTGILGEMGIEDFIQTDAVINRGNSGGPLVNINGEVVGINSNIISSTGMSAGLGFAVPSKLARTAIAQLTTDGKVVRGYMGVSLANLSEVDGSEVEEMPAWVKDHGGAYVAVVVPGSPAGKAGIKPGDVILSLDSTKVTSATDLIEYVRMKRPGDNVKTGVWRDGKMLTVNTKLIERPGSSEVAAYEPPGAAMLSYRMIGIIVDDYVGVTIERGRMARIEAPMVEYVKGGSLADEAGISVGDVIEEVDGNTIADSKSFEKALQAGDLKKGITIKVINRREERTVLIRK